MITKDLYKIFIYYYLLFGLISIPSIFFNFEPSLEYIRILFFSIISFVGIIIFKTKNTNERINKIYFFNLIFIIYILISILWSPSIIDSFRYINKVLFAFSFPFLIYFINVDKEKMIKYIITGFFLILILTIIGEQFRNYILPKTLNDPRFQGFLSVHTTKFVISIITIFFFVFYLYFKKKLYLFSSLIGILIVVLTLQRATIFGLIIGIWGGFLIYNYKRKRIPVSKIIFLSSILIGVLIFLIFYFEPIVNRSFSSLANRDYALLKLEKGHIFEAYRYFLDKGREKIWESATSGRNYIFGTGFGSVSYLIKDYLGIFTEAHNDYVKIFVEIGIIGSILFLLNIYNIFKLDFYILRNTKKDDKINLVLISSSIAILIFCMIVAFFDNLLDHSHHSIIFALIFLFISIKRPKRSKSKISYLRQKNKKNLSILNANKRIIQ